MDRCTGEIHACIILERPKFWRVRAYLFLLPPKCISEPIRSTIGNNQINIPRLIGFNSSLQDFAIPRVIELWPLKLTHRSVSVARALKFPPMGRAACRDRGV